MGNYIKAMMLVLLSVVMMGAMGEEMDKPTMGWLARNIDGTGLGSDALTVVIDHLKSLDLRWIDSSSLLRRLRQRDEREGLLSDARMHLDKGRKLHLALSLDKAIAEYKKSTELLQQGFVLYYDPDLLVEPLLQLGVAQYQAGDRALARQTFMRVAALSPKLKLDEAYYSPSIRKAYSEAVSGLGIREPTIPSPGQLRRICEALDIRGLVVASVERPGERSLLRLGVFDRSYGSFVAVETVALDRGATDEAGQHLADRLKIAIAGMLGLRLDLADASEEPLQAGESSLDGGVSDSGAADSERVQVSLELGDIDTAVSGDEPGSGGQSWAVEHWWIWPVAGVVLTSIAVTLPLTVFREDVVDVKVRY